MNLHDRQRKEEKTKAKSPQRDKDGLFEDPKSLIVFSRLFCNFVMPAPQGRPLPRENELNESYASAVKEDNKRVKTSLMEKKTEEPGTNKKEMK